MKILPKITKRYLSTELLGGFLQLVDVFVKVSGFLAEEDQKVTLDSATEDGAGGFLVELDDQRKRLDRDKVLQVFNGELSGEFSLVVVELE